MCILLFLLDNQTILKEELFVSLTLVSFDRGWYILLGTSIVPCVASVLVLKDHVTARFSYFVDIGLFLFTNEINDMWDIAFFISICTIPVGRRPIFVVLI